jgi:hypothetical protein
MRRESERAASRRPAATFGATAGERSGTSKVRFFFELEFESVS